MKRTNNTKGSKKSKSKDGKGEEIKKLMNQVNSLKGQIRGAPIKGQSSNNVSKMSLPMAQSSIMKTGLTFASGSLRYPGSLKLRGQEFIAGITAGSGSVGEILINQPMSPSSLTGSRLAEFANLFEKYKFSKMNFIFVPDGGIDPGAIILSYDADIQDVPLVGASAIRQSASRLDSMQIPKWSPATLRTKISCPEDGYYNQGQVTDPDNRLSFQGRFTIVNADGFTGNVGSLWLEYELDLFIPSLEEVLLDSEAVYLYKGNGLATAAAQPVLNGVVLATDFDTEGQTALYPIMQSPWDPTQIVTKLAAGAITELTCAFLQQVNNTTTSGTQSWSNSNLFQETFFNKAGTNVTANLIAAGMLIFGNSTIVDGGATSIYAKINAVNIPQWFECQDFVNLSAWTGGDVYAQLGNTAQTSVVGPTGMSYLGLAALATYTGWLKYRQISSKEFADYV